MSWISSCASLSSSQPGTVSRVSGSPNSSITSSTLRPCLASPMPSGSRVPSGPPYLGAGAISAWDWTSGSGWVTSAPPQPASAATVRAGAECEEQAGHRVTLTAAVACEPQRQRGRRQRFPRVPAACNVFCGPPSPTAPRAGEPALLLGSAAGAAVSSTRSGQKVEKNVPLWVKVGYIGRAFSNRPGWRGSSHSATPVENLQTTGTRGRITPVVFRGHFDYSLDAKNRLNLPPKWRGELSEGVVLVQGVDACIEIYTPDAFTRSRGRARGQEPDEQGVPRDHPLLRGRPSTRAGRLRARDVKAQLLEHAGIKKEVVVGGAISYAEVWEPDAWKGAASRASLSEAGGGPWPSFLT